MPKILYAIVSWLINLWLLTINKRGGRKQKKGKYRIHGRSDEMEKT